MLIGRNPNHMDHEDFDPYGIRSAQELVIMCTYERTLWRVRQARGYEA